MRAGLWNGVIYCANGCYFSVYDMPTIREAYDELMRLGRIWS